MRRVSRVLALILALTAPSAVLASEAPPPQITDPANDLNYSIAPTVGFPLPSVDLLAVTFHRDGDDLVTTFRVQDVDYQIPGRGESPRGLYAYFYSDTHWHLAIGAFFNGDMWRSDIMCYNSDRDGTCWEFVDPPIVDTAADTVTVRVPLDLVEGRVLAPTAWSRVDICECGLWTPNADVQDRAPNEGVGQDYDPYA